MPPYIVHFDNKFRYLHYKQYLDVSPVLNDDQIGRLIDIIYKSGLTNLFIEIGLSVIKNFNIETKYVHFIYSSNIIKFKNLKIINKNQD